MATYEELMAAKNAGTDVPAADLQAAEIESLKANLNAALLKLAQVTGAVPENMPRVQKLYFSAVPYTKLLVADGPASVKEIQFVEGRMETDDPVVQKHIDAIIASGSTAISTTPPVETEDVLAMRADLEAMAEKHQSKMVAAGLSTG